MTFRRAAVLGPTSADVPTADELCSAEVAAETWFLPADGAGREAVRLVGDPATGVDAHWPRLLADCDLLVTLFDDARLLSRAVVPRLLPHLPIGAVWLQLGRASADETEGFALAADEYDINFVNGRILMETWHRDRLGIRRSSVVAGAPRGCADTARPLSTRRDPGWDFVGAPRNPRSRSGTHHQVPRATRPRHRKPVGEG